MPENKEKVKCPLCNDGYLEDEISDHETYFREGTRNIKLVVKNLNIKRCNKCKEEFLPKEALNRVQAEKHKKRGLLTMEQLKEIRQKLGYTQEEMADLLGVGKKSYLRWEKGLYLQNKAMDRYIRLIAENPENINILKRISENLPKEEKPTSPTSP
ncbi:MAG: type II toxin-antitoxin system MqsA family antitoxin [Candidatus Omnitrophica bacterium]|nr:type II toxin-antitoxin system MqsA family antitoxin [Candidatus Omnitrophota bacterium]MCM8791525.1 type II toxin-antitoxin system MqsA family antitoxin [Candidatus Omnitrophota bacterium]